MCPNEDGNYSFLEVFRTDFERLFAPGRGWSFCACMLYQRGCHLDALVEAYRTLTPRDPNWAHAGTVSLFAREGFAIIDRPSEKYVVMQRES